MGAASSGEGRRVSGKWETGGLQILRAAGALALVLQEKAFIVSRVGGGAASSVDGSATMRRRTGQAGEKEPKAWAFGCRARHHLCADAGHGRRRSHPLSQRLHSTRVVAGVDILWHASAHKRSPLFRRWAPALNTHRPEGSPGASSCYQGKAAGDPSSRHSADQAVRVYGRWMSQPSRGSSDMLATGTRCRRSGVLGSPQARGGRIDRGRYAGETNLRAISGSAVACATGCAWHWSAW